MKLVVLEPLGVEKETLLALAEEKLGDRAEITVYDTRETDTKKMAERAAEADILVLANQHLPEEVVRECKNLKMISVAFTGVDHIPMKYCREKGILVCNCAGYSNTAVSELVFGMALNLYRHITECNEAVRKEKDKTGLIGMELAGKKFGVIGMGAIGTRTAELAKAFGCQVYGYNRSPRQIDGVTMTDMKTLLSECDIVSLHVPLTEETRGLIGEEELSWMKPEAVLINTARGSVVDSAALAKALNENRIAGAAVDVFEMEPPVPADHPLLRAKNVTATPHVAFATREALYKRAGIVFENVIKFLEGNPQNVM